MNEALVDKICKEIKKKATSEIQDEIVLMIRRDLITYLLNESNEFCTNQAEIGWKQAFRGYTVKVWNNQCKDKYFNHEVSKVIVKLCTNHYIECWYDRNEKYHDEEKKRRYVIEWTEALENMIVRSNKLEAIKCLRNQAVNIQNTSTTQLQHRNKHLIEVYKCSKVDNNSVDIRQYMRVVSNKT